MKTDLHDPFPRIPVGLTMLSGTGIFFRRRVQSTNAQEHICASTVATAAPATPISKRNINTGSSTILMTAPIRVVVIREAGNPGL